MERVRDLPRVRQRRLERGRYGPERSSTAHGRPASQLRGRPSSHRVGALAVLPRTMSSNWPRRRRRCRWPRPWCGTGPAATSGARRGPAQPHRGPVRCRRPAALRPSAAPTRSQGASCIQLIGDLPQRAAQPALACRPAPARVVSFSRGGAISRSCSVTVPAPQPRSGQRHRRLGSVPDQPHRPAERREVHQHHRPLAVRPQRPATAAADPVSPPAADVHPQRLTGLVVDAKHPRRRPVPPTAHRRA